jgi:hypothetical protein
MRNHAVGTDGGSNACLFHPWRQVLTVRVKPTRILHVENGRPRVSSSGLILGTRPPWPAEWKLAPVPVVFGTRLQINSGDTLKLRLTNDLAGDNDPSDPVFTTHFHYHGSHALDFPGKYVFHCHILEHEDEGMMSPVFQSGNTEGLRLALGTTAQSTVVVKGKAGVRALGQ